MPDPLVQSILSCTQRAYQPLLPGFGAAVRRDPRGLEAMVYEPLICSILQGEKVVEVGGRVVTVGEGESIVISHHLPVVSRVTRASAAAPYVALIARIEPAELRGLAGASRGAASPRSPVHALGVARTDAATLGVLARAVALSREPDAVDVLLPLLRRELHFRLLRSAHGAHLGRLLDNRSHASRIGQATHALRRGFRGPLDVDALARSIGMSPSSFYRHFKAVMDTTPLQYHKDLRLTEARRLLLGGADGVAEVAHAVGYESASHFSRDYRRRFGEAPSLARAAPRA